MLDLLKRGLLAGSGVLLLAGNGFAAIYDIDPAHSEVGFRVRHIVSKVRGKFDTFSGTIDFDPAKVSALKTTLNIKATSINTADQKRDDHLRSPDFFNVEKHPELVFKSTKVESVGEGQFKMTGDLTLLGVTKPVVLDVAVGGVADDPWGNTRAGFSATGKLNRKDYGMVFNIAMDKGGVVIGDEVELLIEVEAVQKKKKK